MSFRCDLHIFPASFPRFTPRIVHYSPDFVNAPPKSQIVTRQVEKRLNSKVSLGQEKGFREESSVLGQPNLYGRNGFGSVKNFIDTQTNLVDGNEPFQF